MQKKYILVGIIGLLLSLLLGFFMYSQNLIGGLNGNNSGLPRDSKYPKYPLLSYIPKDFQQILYVTTDNGLLDLVDSVDRTNLPSELGTHLDMLKDVKSMLMSQSEFGNFMFMRVKTGFDIDKAFESGFLMDVEGYSSKYITDDILVYGVTETIDDYGKFDEYAYNDTYISEYFDAISNGEKNVLLIGNIKNQGISTNNSILSQYQSATTYGVGIGKLSKDIIDGKFEIIFDRDLTLSQSYKFESRLSKYVNDSTIGFLEIGNILKISSINKQNISSYISKLYPSVSNNPFLMGDNLNIILSIFDGNIGFMVGEGGNDIGVGLAGIFDNGDSFELIKTFLPVIEQFVLPQEMLSGNINTSTSENQILLNLKLPYGQTSLTGGNLSGDTFNGNITIDRGEDMVINVFDVTMDGKKDIEQFFDDQSLVRIYFNFGKLLDFYNRLLIFNAIPQGNDIYDSLGFLKDKEFYGFLSHYGDKLSLQFKVE